MVDIYRLRGEVKGLLTLGMSIVSCQVERCEDIRHGSIFNGSQIGEVGRSRRSARSCEQAVRF